jgi:GT2 family glycosyltransferase
MEPEQRVIAAVLVTHNRLDHLRRGVEALLAESIDHLVVVDNSSDDGTDK